MIQIEPTQGKKKSKQTAKRNCKNPSRCSIITNFRNVRFSASWKPQRAKNFHLAIPPFFFRSAFFFGQYLAQRHFPPRPFPITRDFWWLACSYFFRGFFLPMAVSFWKGFQSGVTSLPKLFSATDWPPWMMKISWDIFWSTRRSGVHTCFQDVSSFWKTTTLWTSSSGLVWKLVHLRFLWHLWLLAVWELDSRGLIYMEST